MKTATGLFKIDWGLLVWFMYFAVQRLCTSGLPILILTSSSPDTGTVYLG